MDDLDSIFESGEPKAAPVAATVVAEPAKPDPVAEPVKKDEPLPDVKKTVEPSKPKEDDRTVPLAALEAERKKRQELEHRLAEPKKPEPLPDVFTNQEAYAKAIASQLEGSFTQKLQQQSEFFARKEFGAEVIDKDLQIFEQIVDKQMYLDVINSPSPYHAIHEKVEKYKLVKEMENPEAYKARLKAEARAEIEAEFKEAADKKAKETDDLRKAIPTSLAGKPSTGAITGHKFDGPTPLDNLLPDQALLNARRN